MQKNITIIGNVGSDPETITLKEKKVSKPYFDRKTNQFVAHSETLPARELTKFSVALLQENPETGEYEDETTWFQVADFDGLTDHAPIETGLLVEITGDFSTKTVKQDDGSEVTYRNIRLRQPVKILRRPAAAEAA